MPGSCVAAYKRSLNDPTDILPARATGVSPGSSTIDRLCDSTAAEMLGVLGTRQVGVSEYASTKASTLVKESAGALNPGRGCRNSVSQATLGEGVFLEV